MKFLRGFCAVCAAMAVAVCCAAAPGVSRALAQQRKSLYSDVRYALHFAVPALKAAAVPGEVVISFGCDVAAEAVVDFRAEARNILSVRANGKAVRDYTFADDHIVIPKRYMRRGSNAVAISFVAGEKPLNRRDEFVYTLLVPDRARTLFPCFDQPDIKAHFSLSLDVPGDWVALSNTSIADERVADGVRHVTFAETEPLSTYLFSFVAGRFTRDVRSRGGRTISAYHRETDSAKVAQLDTIFAQVFDALDWQEEFTGVKYPFAKYDFVIVPGFQFGGMEHTGATLYNDRMMFLGSHPTPAEELSRAQLIAHETSHMWFGDLVTMAWFDDVWTKEVFANYFAAVITEPHFADINHTLNRISSFYIPSLREERTEGSTAIQQPLDNLQDAGLLYNNIIYDKAPLVMFKIVDIMGKEAYQRGIRRYVQRYAYDNATWDDLVACLDAETDADLRTFSDVWIKAKGMPTITLTPAGRGLDVVQSDRYGRGLTWRQKFTVAAVGADTVQIVSIDLDGERVHCDTDFEVLAVVPNSDGTGYGYFAPDDGTLSYMCKNLGAFADDVMRMSAVLTIYENYLNGRFADADVPVDALLAAARTEGNALIASAIIEALDYACTHSTGERRRSIELAMDSLAETMPSEAGRLQMQRKVVSVMTQPEIVERYQQRWAQMSAPLWSESDYTTAAYELAVRMPQNADSILATQRRRISNADRLKQFDYVSRACTADTVQLDALFESLRDVQNRLIEPYAQSLLYYLNHQVRDAWSARYIAPGLDMLSEIQRTGDIFFPGKWTQMLLSSHRSAEAHAALREWLASHPDCPPLLRNKILLAAERDAQVRSKK